MGLLTIQSQGRKDMCDVVRQSPVQTQASFAEFYESLGNLNLHWAALLTQCRENFTDGELSTIHHAYRLGVVGKVFNLAIHLSPANLPSQRSICRYLVSVILEGTPYRTVYKFQFSATPLECSNATARLLRIAELILVGRSDIQV